MPGIYGGRRSEAVRRRLRQIQEDRLEPEEASKSFGPDAERLTTRAERDRSTMLAYWQGRFWMNYVSGRVEEHGRPGRTGLTKSFTTTVASELIPESMLDIAAAKMAVT